MREARYPSGLRERSAKPPCVGSTPTRASNLSRKERLSCAGFIGEGRSTESLLPLLSRRPAGLFEFAPQRIVNDDGPAIGEGLDGMARITGHDGHQTRAGNLRYAVDGHLQLALDHLVDLFLRMEVLVNCRAPLEVVMRKRHARRVEIASIPAGQAFGDRKAAGVDKRHSGLPRGILARPGLRTRERGPCDRIPPAIYVRAWRDSVRLFRES